MKETFKKWAVIWARDKKILALYGMRKTVIIQEEWESTTGDSGIFDSCMIFEKKSDAEKWRNGNKDWEVVLVEIKIISC